MGGLFQQSGRISAVGFRCYLMTFLAIGVVEANGLCRDRITAHVRVLDRPHQVNTAPRGRGLLRTTETEVGERERRKREEAGRKGLPFI